MRISDYDYALPPELIAQRPTDQRDQSRLLVVPPTGAFEHRTFVDLPELLAPGDALVVNQSRVFPARLLGHKTTGAKAEVLLVRPLAELMGEAQGVECEPSPDPSTREGWNASSTLWEALVRPGGKLKQVAC